MIRQSEHEQLKRFVRIADLPQLDRACNRISDACPACTSSLPQGAQDLRCRRPLAVHEKPHLVGRHFGHTQPLQHHHRRGKQMQNASPRARKGTALAGVGVEGYIGCVELAPPGTDSCALSRPNPWIERSTELTPRACRNPWTELAEVTRHLHLLCSSAPMAGRGRGQIGHAPASDRRRIVLPACAAPTGRRKTKEWV